MIDLWSNIFQSAVINLTLAIKILCTISYNYCSPLVFWRRILNTMSFQNIVQPILQQKWKQCVDLMMSHYPTCLARYLTTFLADTNGAQLSPHCTNRGWHQTCLVSKLITHASTKSRIVEWYYRMIFAIFMIIHRWVNP